MKISIDLTSLCRKITGIEYYARNLTKALLSLDKKNEYVLLFRKEVHLELAEFKNKARFLVCPVNNQIFCEQIWLPIIALKENVELMHFPAFPPGLLSLKRFVFTIHDATIWRYPKTLSWKGKLYFRPLSILGAKRASKITTVSEVSKNDIAKYVPCKIDKIINTGEAVALDFKKELGENASQEIRNKYNLPEKFILSVNSIEPRKNIPNLLIAFRILKDKYNDLPQKLVLVGRKAWGINNITNKIKELELNDDVILTGYIPTQELAAIYKLADIFVFPSIYEGFGLPPLEAMACGVPVIASDIPTLKEVLGNAALFIDPYSPENIASVIKDLISNQEKKKLLVNKGFERCSLYSWDKVAQETIRTYESLDVPKRVTILNVPIDNVRFKDVFNGIEQSINKHESIYIITSNVDHLITLQKDEEFRRIYQGASLVVADGMPLIWAAKFLGTPLKQKISGSDLVPEICKLAGEKGYKLFFLGGRPGAAQIAKDNLERVYPAIKIVGAYSPAFGFENDAGEEQEVLQMIKEAKADILFVGLGAPKQEKWIYKHYKELNIPVSIGVGVTIDFLAGIVKRAPCWMQKAGLEWLWRILMEPKRLWRRYLIEDMKFFWLVLKQKQTRYNKINEKKYH